MVEKILFVYIHDTNNNAPVAKYWIDHNNDAERRGLGAQCRRSFDNNHAVFTCPVAQRGDIPAFPA